MNGQKIVFGMRPRQSIGGIGIGFSIDMRNPIAVANDFYIFRIDLCMSTIPKANAKRITKRYRMLLKLFIPARYSISFVTKQAVDEQRKNPTHKFLVTL